MAQAILSIAVAAIPGIGPVASAILGVAAGIVGGIIDQKLFGKTVKGPALPDLSIPGASPGDPINVLAGKVRVPGAYVWIKTRTETRKVGGGKGIGGGVASSTKVRFVSGMIVWGEKLGGGACTRVEKIFADREPVWEYREPLPDIISDELTLTFYTYPEIVNKVAVNLTLVGPEAVLAPYAEVGRRFALDGWPDVPAFPFPTESHWNTSYQVKAVATTGGVTTLGLSELSLVPYFLEYGTEVNGPGVEITISFVADELQRIKTLRHYLGSEDQAADPFILAAETTSSAYRGLCCTFIEDLDLTPWGGRVPAPEAIVDAGTTTASAVIVDAATAAGIPESRVIVDITGADPPVTGYLTRGPSSARETIDVIASAYDLQADDCGDRLLIRDRLRPVDATVSRTQLGASADGSSVLPLLPVEIKRDLDLPSLVAVRFIDPDRDHQQSVAQSARIPDGGGGTAVVDYPLVMQSDAARSLAERIARLTFQARETATALLPLPYILLETGDILDLGDRRPRWRVASRSLAGAVVALALVCDQDDSDITAALLDPGTPPDPTSPGPPSPVILYLLDLAPLSETDGDLRYYAVAVPLGPKWTTHTLVSGATTEVATLVLPGTGGTALTELPAGPSIYFDRAATVDVYLPYGTLESVSESTLLNSTANTFLIGAEIVRATTCTLIAADTYRLSGLLRGVRGTELEIGNHAIGDVVILLDDALVSVPAVSGEIGAGKTLRAVPGGGVVEDYPPTTFTLVGEALRPLSPCGIRGARDPATGDWTITWVRRSRLSLTWPAETVGLPDDEVPEKYRVRFLSSPGSGIVRTITRTTASVTYTAAQQTADFGAPQTTVNVRVQQISPTVGAGHKREATLT